MIPKVDIQSQNFDYYFYNQINEVAIEGRKLLPPAMAQVVWRKDNKVNKKHIKKFNVLQRLFVLWKAAKKDIFIVVVDEKNGLGPDQFCSWLNANRKKDYGKQTAEDLSCNAMFVLANKELGDTFSYLNRVSHSPMYNYLSKVEGLQENKTKEYSRIMRLLTKMIMKWEMQKRVWTTEANISMHEFYVMISLYVEGEMVGALIYNQLFKRAFHSSVNKIKAAFGTLQNRQLIEKHGEGRGATMRLTGLGIEMINSIISKYSS